MQYNAAKPFRVGGRLIRIARLSGDKYDFVDDPEATLDSVRRSGIRVDLFTFMQRLPHTSPQHRYPMEWDNLAVLTVSSYDRWFNQTIGFKVRNKVRKALKSGVVVREVPFDDSLVKGIAAINNEVPIRKGRRFPH